MTKTVTVIIDDEELALRGTKSAVAEAMPQAEIHAFKHSGELLEFAKKEKIDIAFLDINMRGITGLELAVKLEALQPQINIIFVTGFADYKSDAMDLHASGYLMKPVLAEDILNEIRFLRHPITEKPAVEARCFGNFCLLLGGSPADFDYTKTAELCAYLIDRRGSPVSHSELSVILWEDDSHESYLKRLCADLKHTFDKAGCGDVIISKKGFIGIDTAKISCDYIDYINKMPGSGEAFRGEYMTQYSWAEVTLANLLNEK